MKRDFKVSVVSRDGEKMEFYGKNCTVKKKSMLARLGLAKKIEETIECDETRFE